MSWPLRKSVSSSISGESSNNNTSDSNRVSFNNCVGGSTGVGLVPRAVQLDFDKEEKKIQQLELTNKKFYKDVKSYIEKVDELNKSETKMINNLSNLANTTAAVATIASSKSNLMQPLIAENTTTSVVCLEEEKEFLSKLKLWKDLLNEHNASCENLKQSCQSHVIEPMKKLNSLFPQVYEAIKRRQHAYNELLKQQTKLDKALEKERTGIQIVKIEQLKQLVLAAKQQFQREHLILMEELPKLYNSRVDYIRPCVNTLLQSQANFYDSYSTFYESILNSSEPGSASSLAQQEENTQASSNSIASIEQIDHDIQKCLNEIKSLSIVAGD